MDRRRQVATADDVRRVDETKRLIVVLVPRHVAHALQTTDRRSKREGRVRLQIPHPQERERVPLSVSFHPRSGVMYAKDPGVPPRVVRTGRGRIDHDRVLVGVHVDIVAVALHVIGSKIECRSRVAVDAIALELHREQLFGREGFAFRELWAQTLQEVISQLCQEALRRASASAWAHFDTTCTLLPGSRPTVCAQVRLKWTRFFGVSSFSDTR
jgi:hypothetical protein